MRKIQLTGLPAAVSAEVTNGAVTWVDESLAYWLVKNGEAVYTRAVDAVSDARHSELRSLASAGTLNYYAMKGIEARFTADQWESQRGLRVNDLTVPQLASLPTYPIRFDL
jgi:hypothetical protein